MSRTDSILNLITAIAGTVNTVVDANQQKQQYDHYQDQYGYRYNPGVQELQMRLNYMEQDLGYANNLLAQKSEVIRSLQNERKAEQVQLRAQQDKIRQMVDALNQASEHILELQQELQTAKEGQ